MEVRVTKKTGLTGRDMTRAWTASVINSAGQTVIECSSITLVSALSALERELKEALRSTQELMGRAPEDT